MPSKHCAENELNPMFLALKYKGRGKTCHMHIPRDEHDKKFSYGEILLGGLVLLLAKQCGP
jgi:hypothetical protein